MMNRKGQNIIEYILMAAAVILVLLVILNPRSGPLKNSVERQLNGVDDKLMQVSTDPRTRITF